MFAFTAVFRSQDRIPVYMALVRLLASLRSAVLYRPDRRRRCTTVIRTLLGLSLGSALLSANAQVMEQSDLFGASVVINGTDESQQSSFAPAAVGDVNGDGLGDFSIGVSEPTADGVGRRLHYVVFGRRDTSLPIELASIDGTNGFYITGLDRWGKVVAAGDINGDGFDDVLATDTTSHDNLNSDHAAYLVFGASQRFNPAVDLAALDGANGARIHAQTMLFSSAAGDVNGDGADDLLFTSTSDSRPHDIVSSIVLGHRQPFPATLALDDLDGANGFRILHSVFDGTAASVAAGDINGDGMDDVLIGLPWADINVPDSGTAALLVGDNKRFPAERHLSEIPSDNLILINGDTAGNFIGRHMAALGDVNGDGLDDFVVTKFKNSFSSGEGAVIFGTRDLATLPRSPGALNGENGFFMFGTSVQGAGDINGDDIDDLLSRTAVVFGRTARFDVPVNDFSLDGTDGWHYTYFMNPAGDINGDDYHDLLVNIPYSTTGVSHWSSSAINEGISYVTLGRGLNLKVQSEIESFAKPDVPVTLDFHINNVTDAVLTNVEVTEPRLGSVCQIASLAPKTEALCTAVYYTTQEDVERRSVEFTSQVNAEQSPPTRIRELGLFNSDPIVTLSTRQPTFLNVGDEIFVNVGIRDTRSEVEVSIPGVAEPLCGGLKYGSCLGVHYVNEADIAAGGFTINASVTGPDIETEVTATLFVPLGREPQTVTDVDGTNGFRLDGVKDGDNMASSIAGGGDFNGDGLDDIVLGSPNYDPDNRQFGAATIVFGDAQNTTSPRNVGMLNGNDGVRIDGEFAFTGLGRKVAFTGDMNGDGLDDVVVSLLHRDFEGGDRTIAYVVFGTRDPQPESYSIATVNGANGFRIIDTTPDASGHGVAGAGDFNADGLDDVLISTTGQTNALYVIFGTRNGFTSAVDVNALSGGRGLKITGEPHSRFARSVAGAVDVNNDGVDDILIGAPGIVNTGATWVLYGSGVGFPDALDLSGGISSDRGVRLSGTSRFGGFGFRIGAAGDLNHDGIDDVFISGGEDGTLVLFGSPVGLAAPVSPQEINASDGFYLQQFGANNLASAGDFSGDGIDDLLIGQSFYGREDAGKVYVLFGSATGFAPVITPTDLENAANNDGRVITGGRIDADKNARIGDTVAAAGDFNNDGKDDVLLGAISQYLDGNAAPGLAYLLYGGFISHDNDGGNGDDGNALRIVTTPDRINPPDYGWVLFNDGSKQWINAACRAELVAAGLQIDVMSWADISLHPDGIVKDCSDLRLHDSGSNLSILVTPDRIASGNYGWVVFNDGTKQWIDGTCRDSLEAQGVLVAAKEWAEIEGIEDSVEYQSCEVLLDL